MQRLSMPHATASAGPEPAPSACRTPALLNSHRAWWILGGIVAVSTLLDGVFFNGYFASDDHSYFTAAHDILHTGGYHVAPGLGASRLTLVGWLTLVGLVLPDRVQWAAASFIAWHQLLVVLTYLLGRSSFDSRVGLLAAWGVATIGLFVAYAGCILPDIPMACAWVFALYAFERGLRARHGPRPAAAYGWLLAAGIGVGLGYMAKEASLLLLPFFFVVWLLAERRTPRRVAIARGAAFAAGIGVMVAAEAVALRQLAPQSKYRLSWTVNKLDEDAEAAVRRYGTDPWRRLQWVDQRLDRDVLPAGLKMALIAGFVLFPVVCRRQWALYALPLWAFAYQTWGTMNLKAYMPPTIQGRYFIPLVPFALLVLVAVLVRCWDWGGRWLPARGWRSATRGVVLTCIALYPLSGLDGPNRLAGKLYRADIVGSSDRALRLAQQRPARPIVVARALSGRVVPMLLWQQPQNDVVWMPPLSTDISDISIAASDPAAPLRAAGARWQLLALDPQQQPLPTDPLLELGALLHRRAPRHQWNLAGKDELAIQFDDARFCVEDITTIGLPPTRLDEFRRVLRGEPPFLTTPAAGGGRGVVLYELRTEVRTPMEYNASTDLPLEPACWRPGSGAKAELMSLAEGLWWRSAPSDAGYTWLLPVDETFDACRSVPSQFATLFVVDVESMNAEQAELIVDALGSGGMPRPAERRRLYLTEGENLLVAYNPADETTWRPCFKLTGAGDLRLRRLSVARVRVQACSNLTADQRRYRASSPDERQAVVRPLSDGGVRVALERPRGGYHWLVPAGYVRQPLLEMAAGKRYSFYLSIVQTDHITAQLVMQFYDGADMQTCLDERRVLLQNGLNEISVTTGSAPVYPYLVYKLFDRGEFAVLSLQCVVSAPERPSKGGRAK